jgi:pimeloyl-ACP methyl ester carboxylesterase
VNGAARSVPAPPAGKPPSRSHRALRAFFRALSPAFPGLTASAAGVLFRTPPRHRSSAAELETLASGRVSALRAGGQRIATWTWGHGPPVLLVHGWGSRGARLYSFVRPLTDAGFSVVAFDAPGHGDSAGRLSSLPQFVVALQAAADAAGPLAGILAHSMGGAASTIAMARGLSAGRAVFLAPSANPGTYTLRFAAALGLAEPARLRMQRSLEKRLGFRWEDFDVPKAARMLRVPVLMFHDRDDTDVPWSDGEELASAWPDALLVTTQGLGHRRIVHDAAVVQRAVEFLAHGSQRLVWPPSGRPARVDFAATL